MPSSRGLPPSPSRSDRFTYVRARVYQAQHQRPVWKLVQTQVPSRRHTRVITGPLRRYPWVEGLFERRDIHQHIHDAKITVRTNDQDEKFLVFVQNHLRLSFNNALDGIWRGDVVVMRLAFDSDEVVNMRSQDAQKVDQALMQYVYQIYHGYMY